MRTKVVLPLFETDTMGGNMSKYFHDVTLDMSHCNGKTACGTKVFIDDKEIRGVTEIQCETHADIFDVPSTTLTLTLRVNKLITKTPYDNEVDDGK